MSYPIPVIAESIERDVATSEADFALTMLTSTLYEFVSNTACWIKQGGAWLLTCATKANTVDADYFTLTIDGVRVDFELDVTGDGLTAAGSAAGRSAIDVSSATTAAQVAALVRTAILAAFTSSALAVTDNTDGTLTIVMRGAQIAMTEHVAHASFTVAASTALAATAGSGSIYTPANLARVIDGKAGQTLSVIRDAADGKASLTRLRFGR